MLFTDWMGLSGLALVWLLFALRLPFAQRLDGKRRALLVGLGYVLVMFPIAGWSPAIWLRGMVGDLSITSMLLLSAAVYACPSARISPPALGRRRSKSAPHCGRSLRSYSPATCS
jgi:hypothetical protein